MRQNFYCILFIFLSSVPVYSQFKTFAWSDSVKADWGMASIDYEVDFNGDYMCKSVCDFSYGPKCYPQISLFEYKENSFQSIKQADLFIDGGKQLLEIANKKVAVDYELGKGKVHDCFTSLDPPGTLNWENISVNFDVKGITLSYYFDSGTYCDAYNWSDTLVAWSIVEPMLKNPLRSTPNFCTPSGPKVNVRAEENVKSEALFQLDKGQFFEILSTGKADKVNGKSGSWYKINFEGKTGFIFSFYTLCKE